jgi:hypothetical protein
LSFRDQDSAWKLVGERYAKQALQFAALELDARRDSGRQLHHRMVEKRHA